MQLQSDYQKLLAQKYFRQAADIVWIVSWKLFSIFMEI